MNRPIRQLLFISGCFLSLAADTVAAELYKYLNEDGITVLDSHVPARYVKNGYTILSLDGRILEVVPRSLSDEELRERDRLLANQEREERERREREVFDQNLLRLYGTPGDVIRARDAKIASIDGLINTQKGNIQRLEVQQRQLEATLADIERSGGKVSNDGLARIRTIENRILQIVSEIEKKEEEKEDLKVTYASDLARLKELYAQKNTRRP